MKIITDTSYEAICNAYKTGLSSTWPVCRETGRPAIICFDAEGGVPGELHGEELVPVLYRRVDHHRPMLEWYDSPYLIYIYPRN